MYKFTLPVLIAGIVTLVTSGSFAAETKSCPPPQSDLSFAIFNGGDDVGELNLTVTKSATETHVDVDMSISISLFTVPAYKFHHRSKEIWADGALVRSNARTVDNGRTELIAMKNLGDRYLVDSDYGSIPLTGARLSELIWCEALVGTGTVISTLSGSVTDYPIKFVGTEMLEINGRPRLARHYRFTRKKRVGDMWYDGDGVILRINYPTRYYTVASFVRKE